MGFPYMPLFVKEYLADTSHLTAEESGAYMHLLMVMWCRGGTLEHIPQDLQRIARVAPQRWSRVWRSLAPFFTIEDGVVRNKRLTEEWNHVSDIRVKAQSAAHARWNKNNVLADADASPSAKHPDSYPESKKKYKFAGRTIKLTPDLYDEWKRRFTHIDLDAHLRSLDDWVTGEAPGKPWIYRVEGALRNRNAKAAPKKKGLAPLAFRESRVPPPKVESPEIKAAALAKWHNRGKMIEDAVVCSNDEGEEGTTSELAPSPPRVSHFFSALQAVDHAAQDQATGAYQTVPDPILVRGDGRID